MLAYTIQQSESAHEAQKKKKKHNQKMGGRPKQTFLQGRHTGGPSSLDVEGPVPTVSFSGYASHLS